MKKNTQDIKTILVFVGCDLIGDALMKIPFIRAIRKTFPNAHVTWLAGRGRSAYKTLLEPVVSEVIDEVIDDQRFGRKVTDFFHRPFLKKSYDLIFDTQRSVRTTLILKRIPHKVFVSSSANFFFSDIKPSRPHHRPIWLVEQLMELVSLVSGKEYKLDPFITPPKDLQKLAQKLLKSGPQYIGLAPGAGGRHKCWPLEKYIKTAQELVKIGKTPVFIIGPAETEWYQEIKESVPTALFPLQETTLSSPLLTIALAQRLEAAVSNDCGVGHLCAAADAPLVTLFGPTYKNILKFKPLASTLTVIDARKFGDTGMNVIPVSAVLEAIERTCLGRLQANK